MWYKSVIVLVGFMVALCAGLPASVKEDVELVSTTNVYGDKPIVDTGLFGGWENPFGDDPFGSLSSNLEGILDRMRQQIASLLNLFPASNSTEAISPFPAGLETPLFPGLAGIDLSKGNSSSVTKVIDGRTVVINETEYKNEDDFGGTFFKVRIIDVKPESSEATTEKEAESATAKDREEVANSMENEILKSKETEATNTANVSQNSSNDQFANLETFDEVASFEPSNNPPSVEHENRSSASPNEEAPEWSFVEGVDTVDSNDIEEEKQSTVDLSRDVYVNEILAREGAPTNPNAEVFVVENIQKPNPSR
ncbi:uncharacterized protein vir-1 [Euwallacea similis]|uniref:uncharacterized protein vir-1 n=1 Tax=Euwallacea similis TaxID=1736056 RepID=UPI00344C3D3B